MRAGNARPHGSRSFGSQSEAGSQRHVLDISRGRALLTLAAQQEDGGRRAELRRLAHAALMRALDGDPASTMAYQDLGNFYVDEWALNVTWDCWAVARMLAPRHVCVQGIEGIARRHRSMHPGFF
jgi:hypothetical protein